MKAIRRVFGEDESVDPDLVWEELFLGNCFGIALNAYDAHSDSYPNRKQVGFYILHEDDGYWFTSENFSATYWLPDLQEVAQAALTWVKENCEEFKPANCGGAIMGWLWKEPA